MIDIKPVVKQQTIQLYDIFIDNQWIGSRRTFKQVKHLLASLDAAQARLLEANNNKGKKMEQITHTTEALVDATDLPWTSDDVVLTELERPASETTEVLVQSTEDVGPADTSMPAA